MVIKNVLVIVTVGVLAAGTARAATWEDRFRYEREAVDKYPPHEMNIDLFGTYATRDRFGVKGDFGGGGLGLNYFFTRFLGIGADSYIEEWKWPYRVNGSLFLRYPLQVGIAPYAFGGGGRQFKYLPQWTYHGGGGAEYRINAYTGFFADARRVFSDRTSSLDYTLVRGGMRLSF